VSRGGAQVGWGPAGEADPPDFEEAPLFRRTKTDAAPVETPATDTNGRKGRPTPTRKEAEAANRAKAMRSGDDRYLPPRDKGPVRRFIRDYVDSKFSLIELLIPLMLLVLVVGWTGTRAAATYANLAMLAVFLVIVVDLVRLRFRLRKELAARFPDADTHGATYYAIARSMQMRFMRMPKAQVKVGQRLPERYR
jgi:hypothetical protein